MTSLVSDHRVFQGPPNVVNTLHPQAGTVLFAKVDSGLSKWPIGDSLGSVSTVLQQVSTSFPFLAPVMGLINPDSYTGLLFDSHSLDPYIDYLDSGKPIVQ